MWLISPYQSNDFYYKKIVVFENGLPAANWTVFSSNHAIITLGNIIEAIMKEMWF